MKNPVGADGVYDIRDPFVIGKIDLMSSGISENFIDAPGSMLRPQQQMQLVTVTQQPPREIGADKSASSSEDDALHTLNEILVVKDFKIVAGPRADLLALLI